MADLLERWAVRKIVLGAIIVHVLGQLGHRSVSRIPSEPDFLPSALNAPTGPQGVSFVERRSCAGMLTWEAADAGKNIRWGARWQFGAVFHGHLRRVLRRREFEFSFLPPIKLRDFFDTGCRKPLFITQRDEKVDVWVLLFDSHYRWVIHMIIVVMGDDDSIDRWDVLDLTGDVCISFWSQPTERTAPLTEDRVEQNSESTRKFNKIASMS